MTAARTGETGPKGAKISDKPNETKRNLLKPKGQTGNCTFRAACECSQPNHPAIGLQRTGEFTPTYLTTPAERAYGRFHPLAVTFCGPARNFFSYAVASMPSTYRLKDQPVSLDFMPRDGYKLVAHGLAHLCRLAAGEGKVALEAAQALLVFGEGLLESQKASQRLEKARIEAAKGHPGDRAQLISELKGLYAQALGSGALIVEATAETDNQ